MCDHISSLNIFKIQLVSAVSQLVNLPLNPTLAAITALSLCGTSGLSVSLMGDQGCHKSEL